ncbi:tRNA lysidine(34) synthetase TilS, partial [Lactobacillus nasalidis]
MDIKDKLAAFFAEEGLPLKGSFLVAVSGGPDSMALLDLMRRLPGNFSLAAAHLDHQLRPDSWEEGRVLRAYCRKYQIPLYESVWPKSLHPRRGLEAAAREYRYGFLLATARQIKADCLLTAHHGDDLLENILLKLIRSGIPREMNSLKPVSRRGPVKLVRPLLAFSKAELLAYAAAAGLDYVEDSTNSEDITARNRLRREVIPLLKAENPGILANACRFSQEMTAAEDYFARTAASLPAPQALFGGWRIPRAASEAETELFKAYLENFVQKKYNKRVQFSRRLLASGQSQEKAGLHLQLYQKHYWLYPAKQPPAAARQAVEADRPFWFQGRCFLLSR